MVQLCAKGQAVKWLDETIAGNGTVSRDAAIALCEVAKAADLLHEALALKASLHGVRVDAVDEAIEAAEKAMSAALANLRRVVGEAT